MRKATALQAQLTAMEPDRLRILIVGAGVAGLTLAQELRRQGLHPVVIERAAPDAGQGYMLALVPLVDPVLRDLGVQTVYREHSQPSARYQLHGRHGQLIREYSMADLLSKFGDYRGIARGDLLQVLSDGDLPVTFGATVSAIVQTSDVARATITADAEVTAEFDLVIAADGLHSTTRDLVWRRDQVSYFDCGWGGWVAWSEPTAGSADLAEETWGAGFFLGVYPVKGRDGIFFGGNRKDTAVGAAQFAKRAQAKLTRADDRAKRALTAVIDDPDPYYWKLIDCRTETWSIGRVGLIGDAAAGFLPTAGIGAAMAMESAGRLARRLKDADPSTIPTVLRGFEQAQRPRVEAAQDNSRQLARLAFRQSSLVAAVRNNITRFIPLRVALGPIRKLHEHAPAF